VKVGRTVPFGFPSALAEPFWNARPVERFAPVCIVQAVYSSSSHGTRDSAPAAKDRSKMALKAGLRNRMERFPE